MGKLLLFIVVFSISAKSSQRTNQMLHSFLSLNFFSEKSCTEDNLNKNLNFFSIIRSEKDDKELMQSIDKNCKQNLFPNSICSKRSKIKTAIANKLSQYSVPYYFYDLRRPSNYSLFNQKLANDEYELINLTVDESINFIKHILLIKQMTMFEAKFENILNLYSDSKVDPESNSKDIIEGCKNNFNETLEDSKNEMKAGIKMYSSELEMGKQEFYENLCPGFINSVCKRSKKVSGL